MLPNTEADILERIISPQGGELSEGVAQEILAWRFSDQDRTRMSELSEKASEGMLSEDERSELEGYLLMAHLLTIAHSKARQSLRRHQASA